MAVECAQIKNSEGERERERERERAPSIINYCVSSKLIMCTRLPG